MYRILITTFLLCFLAACASEGTARKTESRAEAIARHNATAKPEDQIICNRVQEGGSMYGKKICRRRGLEREK